LDVSITASYALSDNIKIAFSRILPEHQKQSVRHWLKKLYPKGEVTSIDISDMKDSDVNLNIAATLTFDSEIEKDINALPIDVSIAPALNFFSQYYILTRPDQRKNDFITGFGYDIRAEWMVEPPGGDFSVGLMPDEKRIDSNFFTYNMICTKKAESVRALTNLTFRTAHIPKTRYKDFYDDFNRMMANSTARIVFRRQKIDEQALALQKAVKSKPGDIDSQLKLSKRFLRTGKYSEAHQILEKAVKLDPNNGELYYYLGIALGYVNQYDAAKESLNKARDLGYIP
jgi:tetratricopeptide (TPR) repeat protein